MRSLIVAALAALVLGLVGAQVASAGPFFYSDAPGRPLVGSQRQPATFRVLDPTLRVFYTITCTRQDYNGTKPASGVTGLLYVYVQPNDCSTVIAGTARSVVSDTCTDAWSFSLGDYSSFSGGAAGYVTDCSNLRFLIPSLSCSVDYARVGNSNGFNAQDRNAADTVSVTHLGFGLGGMRLYWNYVPITYRSNCSGIAPAATGRVSGDGFIPGVWVGP
jgi:hypothetical protein